jgi:hypothetical protein
MTWYFPRLAGLVPHWLREVLYPIDKTNLDMFRFCHFLALAVITVRFVPINWPKLQWPIFQPAILSGQHSLEVFCLGVFLSFAGHFVFTEVSNSIPVQILVCLVGILLMISAAALLRWYKRLERGSGRASPAVRAGLAGGEA